MSIKLPSNRYSVLYSFIIFFLLTSLIVRTSLLLMSAGGADFTFIDVLRIYFQGLVFDVGVACFISLTYSIYLLILPQRWNNSRVNRIFTYCGSGLVIMLVIISFFAEITFWQEFESRFNFIAVDYLIYTYEVIHNIQESYPMPLLLGFIFLTSALVLWLMVRKNIFATSFRSHTPFLNRLLVSGMVIIISIIYLLFVKNAWAEQSDNHYANELSKAGIYSFFAAYKNNEINYDDFYKLIDKKQAIEIVRKGLQEEGVSFTKPTSSIRRLIQNDSLVAKPNVIMITIESLSADFLGSFGNTQNITPFLDSLAKKSVLFTNMYATGNRTVRGMEALTLSIPPTPGSSIVRRLDNENLFTVGSIFKREGYATTFVYGGDGYFDNMNKYFGSNGFDVIDRGRNIIAGDKFSSTRTLIKDTQVHFENAWGICDEDLYDVVISDADLKYASGKPFYHFVMTTSNHRPYTYPPNKIDIPSGSGREGAVKYTDYAIKQFFQKIKDKPWFNNTVIILVADHCASSAGKNEIDIAKYHIPCLVVNLKTPAISIDKMCSQIDLYPTLFKQLGWPYESNLFGENVLHQAYIPRIVLGTYQKLGYMRNDSLVILGPQRTCETFIYKKASNEQLPAKFPDAFVNEAVAQYQTAYSLFKSGGLKE